MPVVDVAPMCLSAVVTDRPRCGLISNPFVPCALVPVAAFRWLVPWPTLVGVDSFRVAVGGLVSRRPWFPVRLVVVI